MNPFVQQKSFFSDSVFQLEKSIEKLRKPSSATKIKSLEFLLKELDIDYLKESMDSNSLSSMISLLLFELLPLIKDSNFTVASLSQSILENLLLKAPKLTIPLIPKNFDTISFILKRNIYNLILLKGILKKYNSVILENDLKFPIASAYIYILSHSNEDVYFPVKLSKIKIPGIIKILDLLKISNKNSKKVYDEIFEYLIELNDEISSQLLLKYYNYCTNNIYNIVYSIEGSENIKNYSVPLNIILSQKSINFDKIKILSTKELIKILPFVNNKIQYIIENASENMDLYEIVQIYKSISNTDELLDKLSKNINFYKMIKLSFINYSNICKKEDIEFKNYLIFIKKYCENENIIPCAYFCKIFNIEFLSEYQFKKLSFINDVLPCIDYSVEIFSYSYFEDNLLNFNLNNSILNDIEKLNISTKNNYSNIIKNNCIDITKILLKYPKLIFKISDKNFYKFDISKIILNFSTDEVYEILLNIENIKIIEIFNNINQNDISNEIYTIFLLFIHKDLSIINTEKISYLLLFEYFKDSSFYSILKYLYINDFENFYKEILEFIKNLDISKNIYNYINKDNTKYSLSTLDSRIYVLHKIVIDSDSDEKLILKILLNLLCFSDEIDINIELIKNINLGKNQFIIDKLINENITTEDLNINKAIINPTFLTDKQIKNIDIDENTPIGLLLQLIENDENFYLNEINIKNEYLLNCGCLIRNKRLLIYEKIIKIIVDKLIVNISNDYSFTMIEDIHNENNDLKESDFIRNNLLKMDENEVTLNLIVKNLTNFHKCYFFILSRALEFINNIYILNCIESLIKQLILSGNVKILNSLKCFMENAIDEEFRIFGRSFPSLYKEYFILQNNIQIYDIIDYKFLSKFSKLKLSNTKVNVIKSAECFFLRYIYDVDSTDHLLEFKIPFDFRNQIKISKSTDSNKMKTIKLVQLLKETTKFTEIFLMWKSQIDSVLSNHKECLICYSIVDPKYKTFPQEQCANCLTKFHRSCIFKWIGTSKKGICPLCRVDMEL